MSTSNVSLAIDACCRLGHFDHARYDCMPLRHTCVPSCVPLTVFVGTLVIGVPDTATVVVRMEARFPSHRLIRAFLNLACGLAYRDLLKSPPPAQYRDSSLSLLEAAVTAVTEGGAQRAIKLCDQVVSLSLKQWALLPSSGLSAAHATLLTVAQRVVEVRCWLLVAVSVRG